MSMNVAKWCNTAYDASLRSGRALTPEQAELEFGTPPSGVNVTELLEAMVRDGLMLRETWREENPFSLSRVRTQYRAIEKREIPLPPRPRASYFDGLVRVSSVFELGAAYERID